MFYVLLCVALCPFWCCSRLDGEGGLVALLCLSSWCLAVVGRLFLAVPQGCLRFLIVVFPDHTHLLFLSTEGGEKSDKETSVQARVSLFNYLIPRINPMF